MTQDVSATIPRARHVVVLCHPDPESFNREIADTYCAAVRAVGHDVVFRDLYAIGFDPVLKTYERPALAGFQRSADVARELALIRDGDVFVLIYPIWFGSAPAMMKGYVERVLGAGVDPQAIQRHDASPLLGGKRLLSFTTSAARTLWLDAQGGVEGLRDVFDRYLVGAFGMHSQRHIHLGHITPHLSERFARQDFCQVEEEARRTCDELQRARDGRDYACVA
ncbi:NAD(P)H-dependent oxidoreductase [Sphingomonas sp. TREG-RG-20F-R18-01]|uniref:NAD(P)H-dependent oxidoreductase n=1 Tax=Sphingomonas sp. TREG-RG-20F-R18-01 TaxID=2914982 RepID=UPI001F55EBDB|nr:NAD(P)H-dependent oxidoreductase [Sphingomonas sp. TREG-RG-20F-R18-01]